MAWVTRARLVRCEMEAMRLCDCYFIRRELLLTFGRYDMGLDSRYGWDPVRSVQHGGALQFHAHQRRSVLRVCGTCTSRLGSSCGVDNRME